MILLAWSIGDWVNLAIVAAILWFLLNIRGNGDGGQGDQWYDRGRP